MYIQREDQTMSMLHMCMFTCIHTHTHIHIYIYSKLGMCIVMSDSISYRNCSLACFCHIFLLETKTAAFGSNIALTANWFSIFAHK